MTWRSCCGVVLLVVGLSACDAPEPGPSPRRADLAAAPAAEALGGGASLGENPSVYRCEDGRVVRVAYPDSETAILQIGGETQPLKVAPSASGARYVGGGWQWWSRGMDEGMISSLAPGEDLASAASVICRAESALSNGSTAPQSAQGAKQVVRDYHALLAEGRFDEARALWRGEGEASEMAEGEFAASFARYETYAAEVGEPGAVEGAAGSLYVEVPVHVHGTLTSGESFHLRGPMRLRRSNNVPGATTEDLAWRIVASGLRPRSD